MIGRRLVPPKPVMRCGDVREEALATLLAVVADVDAGRDLAAMTSAVAASTAVRSSSASTSSPRLRRPCNAASSAGRGRLPAWVTTNASRS